MSSTPRSSSMSSTKAPKEADATYSKAAMAELGRDWDQAFSLYIKAAESYLHISRTSLDESLRTKCQANAGKALERAEKIKSARRNLAPVTVNPFSEQDQFYVLRKSSRINGLVFPLWNEPIGASGEPNIKGQPKLSLEQLKVTPDWRKPAEVIPQLAVTSPSLLPHDIVQHVVTDCSVCSSISVCLEHHRRFGSKLGLSSLHPQDSGGIPCLSENGLYELRFFFNGGSRRIVIDDYLPFHPNGSLICMCTRSNIILWPSLLEKAYMKLMGGYDFPGSNSSIDIHTLAGWIPEHFEIKSPLFERENTWSRIADGFAQGNVQISTLEPLTLITTPGLPFLGHCVLTVGTGERTGIRWNGAELVGSHSYAVTNVTETETGRQFTILDSWFPKAESTDPNSQPPPQEPRVLHIPWADICDVFDGIYLSWNPSLFKNVLNFHGIWKPKHTKDNERPGSNQFLRLVFEQGHTDKNAQDVWILLTRHVTDIHQTSEYIALRVETQDDETSPDTYKLASKGAYTNSTHALVRRQIPQFSEALSIFASYDGPSDDIGFTVTAYSSTGISWDKTVPKAPFTTKVDGVLTSKNAGGNCTYPTFMVNPQYHLRLHPGKQTQASANARENVILTMQGSRDVPFHVTIVWSQGERAVELAQKEVAAHSGAYSYGFARVSKQLPIGDYTVVVSAFEPHHMGPFSLTVESYHRFDLQPIPHEGAGMYSKTVRGAWDAETAVGGPNSKRYSLNPIFNVDVTTLTQLKVRLQLVRPSTASLNVTLFPPSNGDSLGPHILTSGPYSDAISGVATPIVSLTPGKYQLIPSTYTPGVQAVFRLIVYSTSAGVNITPRNSMLK